MGDVHVTALNFLANDFEDVSLTPVCESSPLGMLSDPALPLEGVAVMAGWKAGVKKLVSTWGLRDERRDFIPGAGRAGDGVVERAVDGRFLLLQRLLLGAAIGSTQSCKSKIRPVV